MADAAPPSKPSSPKPSGGKRPPMQAVAYWGMVIGVWLAIFVVVFIAFCSIDLPSTSSLDKVERRPSITYLDRSGALLAVRGSQLAPPVEIDELPPYVPAAFLAIEDRKFYHHPGFDPIGIARAAFGNIFKKKGSNLAGGSTITQQLARNLFLSKDQNIKRKAQELILAVWLEHKFTKKQILALYLNRVDFGAGATGIEAASQRYFNKSAKDLSVGEAALLAGMMKGPSRYSPISNTERASRRANIVLNEMVRSKVITEEERDEVLKSPVKVTRTLASAHALYFIDYLDLKVRELVGDQQDDLVVETTLDLSIQGDAERAVKTIMDRDVKKGVQQSALVAVDGEGRIRAFIGGVSYADSQFNRAIDAHRQPGSSFKPFVYLTAMEKGYTPDTPVTDEPVTIGNWTPENYTKKYMGDIDLRTALAQSINTVAAQLADVVGRDNVVNTAHRLGIESKLNTDPAMALGAVEVTPIEMAQAYVPFSNGGYKATAHGIVRIRTTKGKVVYQYIEGENGTRIQVINNPALSEMNEMLRGVITSGSGTGAAVPGYDIAGKTGTTSDYRDAWFAGYTGGFVTVVWVGRDDNTPMAKVTGGGTPAAIWKSFMSPALKRIKVNPIPSGNNTDITPESLDAVTNLLNSGEAPTPANGDQPAQNSADKSKSLDDVFSEAQRNAQGQ
jgi:penicillin-binding protein 1A